MGRFAAFAAALEAGAPGEGPAPAEPPAPAPAAPPGDGGVALGAFLREEYVTIAPMFFRGAHGGMVPVGTRCRRVVPEGMQAALRVDWPAYRRHKRWETGPAPVPVLLGGQVRYLVPGVHIEEVDRG